MESKSVDKLIIDLKERAKELNCLYEVEEIMSKPNLPLEEVFRRIVNTLPAGWQYSDTCQARIVYGDFEVQTEGFQNSPWVQHADILVQDEVVGRISVCYTEERPPADEGPFLKEERKLINTIADRLKHRILHTNLKTIFERAEAEGGVPRGMGRHSRSAAKNRSQAAHTHFQKDAEPSFMVRFRQGASHSRAHQPEPEKRRIRSRARMTTVRCG